MGLSRMSLNILGFEMDTETTTTTAADAAPTGQATASVVDSFDLTLHEFCIRLSTKKHSPELIGGFHHAQKLAGVLKDSEAALTAAFDAFCNQPA